MCSPCCARHMCAGPSLRRQASLAGEVKISAVTLSRWLNGRLSHRAGSRIIVGVYFWMNLKHKGFCERTCTHPRSAQLAHAHIHDPPVCATNTHYSQHIRSALPNLICTMYRMPVDAKCATPSWCCTDDAGLYLIQTSLTRLFCCMLVWRTLPSSEQVNRWR